VTAAPMPIDQSGITSRDWNTYPILKMTDVPEIKVVLLHRPLPRLFSTRRERLLAAFR
jgi:CO/xanthine dehydrogenase Mo-binding subunit